jgi:leucyl/phenylalanyl-tRNA--protein transferase
MPARLGAQLRFPDPGKAQADGLVAIGGDLSPARLRVAYRSGIFPWTANPITWWSPDPRAIFELENFHVPRSLMRFLRKKPLEFTRNRAFRAVMQACAAGHGETWITAEFIEAYTRLHEEGDAHSVECWLGGELVGGIYGVSAGGLFAGESMFHRVANASKAALVYLVEHLRSRGFTLFDIQMITPVTRQLGAMEVPRAEYLTRLDAAVRLDCAFR